MWRRRLRWTRHLFGTAALGVVALSGVDASATDVNFESDFFAAASAVNVGIDPNVYVVGDFSVVLIPPPFMPANGTNLLFKGTDGGHTASIPRTISASPSGAIVVNALFGGTANVTVQDITVNSIFSTAGLQLNGIDLSSKINLDAETYVGGMAFNNVTVNIDDADDLGLSSNPIQIGSAAQLNVASSTTIDHQITGIGGGFLYLGVADNKTVDITSGITELSPGFGLNVGALSSSGAGTVVLSGANTYTGATSVTAGKLLINGSVASGAFVAGLGATLGGSGTIGGDLTVIAGHLSPGNSIGTLTVAGNSLQFSGSQYDVEIDAHGNSDRLDVTGTAALGGTVNVLAAPGGYVDGQRYQIVDAGSISGVYDGVTDDLALFDVGLEYTPHGVSLLLTSLLPPGPGPSPPSKKPLFENLGQNHNQRQAGAGLDQMAGSSGYMDLAGAFQQLTHDQAAAGLQQLGGDLFATTPQIGLQNATFGLQNIVSRIRSASPGAGFSQGSTGAGAVVGRAEEDAPIKLVGFQERDRNEATFRLVDDCAGDCADCTEFDPLSTAWVIGYGLGGTVDGDGNAVGSGYGLGGTQFGIDVGYDGVTRVGLYGGYVGTEVEASGIDHDISSDGGQVGLYARREAGGVYALAVAGVGFDEYDSRRRLAIGPLDSTLRADYSGWQGLAYSEAGLTLGVGAAELQPYLGLQYVHLRQDGFTESGGVGALDVEAIDADSLRSQLGGRLALPLEGRRLTPHIRAAWLHEFLDTDQVSNARFGATGGSSFAVRGLDLGRDWVLAGAGLDWAVNDRLTVFGGYDTQANDRQIFHAGTGGLSYIW